MNGHQDAALDPAAAQRHRTRPPANRASSCPASAHLPAGEAGARTRPGAGALVVELVDGQSAVVACTSTSPLRLLLPRPRGVTAWAVAASHGGGLVGGDDVAIDVAVGAGARALLTTQAETKVYRSIAGPSCQALRARVADGGLLALLPEPVSAFAGATYLQRQRVDLAAGASLVLVDAIAAGRVARGERWAFDLLTTANEVAVGGRVLLAEALRLSGRDGRPVADRLEAFDLVATVVLCGPRLAGAARALLEAVAGRPAEPGALMVAASPLGDGLHLRLLSRSVETGTAELHRLLHFLPELLGEDPLDRRP